MMKKSLVTFASALVLASAFVSNASARDGFYFGLRGGMTNYNLNNKEDTSVDKARVDFGNVWHMSGAIGYRYGFIRLEAEYIYRDDVDDDYTYKLDPNNYKFSSTLESDSFMANAYLDFMPNYWISPYIQGGIGLTRLDLTNQDHATVAARKDSYSSDNFTWSVGGGISLRLNKCVNLDAGYRYMDMGDINEANINAHEVYGGLRYTF